MRNYTFQEKLLIFLDSFLGFEYKFKFELIDYIERAKSEKEFIEDAKDIICSFVGEKEYRTICSLQRL